MSDRVIPDSIVQVQTDASDPNVSAWVSANAGSGKTHVLAQRVIRLLLDGNDPSTILCITFTKAAAANMARRVFDTLAAWTTLDDDALDREILPLSNEPPGRALRGRARRLFALALETPGGLKVQTIHAFCTRLLHQFPFEANVAARFTVMDDAERQEMLDRLSLGVLLEAAAAPESALGRSLATAIAQAADQTFKEVVNEAIGLGDTLTRWIAAAGSIEVAIAQLCGTLGVNGDDTLQAIEAGITDGLLPPGEWSAVADVLDQGSTSDGDQAQKLRDALAATGTARADIYCSFFLTGDEEPRKRLVTKAIANAHPALAQQLVNEQARLARLIERRRGVICRDRTAALIAVADAVLKRYRHEKDQRALLDYDDLIDKTRALLASDGAPSWVQYKLDLGINHVLVDEAQDTSPAQWEIIDRVIAEFAAGAGARGAMKRTMFAVGDEKQSIFSFQGAVPRMFDEKRTAFRKQFDTPELGWRDLRFAHSFRSGASVLGAVDIVFKAEAVFAGVTSDAGGVPVHLALPYAMPGEVEVWPLAHADGKREVEGWDAPFDEVAEQSPTVALADRIVRRIRAWQAQLLPIGRTRRPLTPGDVLILVSRRGPLFEAIIRALKNADIPVAGADRLVLTEHIAVMDLMVLADALLLPDDDLALAIVLRSPLFDFSDTDLFDLAWSRPGSLRAALMAKANDRPIYAAAAAKLATLTEAARAETPFGFYARLLGPWNGRRQFMARLGGEANDALDEFLNLALDFERRTAPSLQGFVAWLRAARAEVKRDMEIVRDEVRVMTVHGAKGLEAPVVILADTTAPPQGHAQHQARLLALPAPDAPPGTPDRLVWAGARTQDVPAMANARALARRATEEEYRRLLYVAMTRASERLVVCGVEGERRRPEGCWYDLVHDALRPHAREIADETGHGVSLLYGSPGAETRTAPDESAPSRTAAPPPSWLAQRAPQEAPALRPISPSTAEEEAGARFLAAGSAADRRKALTRGRLVHRLLQSLPDLAPERRAEVAEHYLARAGGEFTPAERAAMTAKVLALLEDARFVSLFVPGSRAEVPIVGRLARPGRAPLLVSGQVDRLAITATGVLIADYKTNRDAPREAADVPAAYVTQLALYRTVLGRLYPDRPVRAALVWTDPIDLMELSSSALDAELVRLTTA